LLEAIANNPLTRFSPSARIDPGSGPGQALSPPGRGKAKSRLGLAVAILAGLTLVRVIGLAASVVDLFPDEAQYWAWSRDLAWGYFSKPPLLAWTIAAADHVCGSAEACIRAPAPILYFATSLLVYAIAATLYDDRAAFWASMLTALGTGVVFSARIISTDVPLLLFWALALLAYVKLLQQPKLSWSVVLGLALGLGLLAKYAMIYFLLGAGLAALFEADARKLLADQLDRAVGRERIHDIDLVGPVDRAEAVFDVVDFVEDMDDGGDFHSLLSLSRAKRVISGGAATHTTTASAPTMIPRCARDKL